MGFKHAMMTLDLARPGVAAQAVGAAQGALDLAIVYASRRQQFGVPISNHQMVQKMLADMAMKTEAARWLVYAAAAAVESGSQVTGKMAAMAKCFATDVAMEVATDAVQIFGGYGYMEDYPIAKSFRDAKILQIYEGTNQIQRIVIARHLIKEAGELEHLAKYIPTTIRVALGDGNPLGPQNYALCAEPTNTPQPGVGGVPALAAPRGEGRERGGRNRKSLGAPRESKP